MYLVDLVKLVIARKKRKKGQNLEVDTAHPPVVHLVIIIAVREQTFRRPIPSSTDILGERRL